ncbi:putative methyltransferase [Sphingobium sp. SYK-6]|uniref:class I SAM-dependent methyltransferase n=1 Tax=Sphingobium sp. (strain NBRC 103272 / SYK-6) TaxID=627192 RepID=UPI00022772E4|nr:methyltransferase domain-containing protein [Sphingobium sp. SYK-6]BAK67025.1 putative methyltransferase [Sphingobium sp. SYK-6]
MTAAERIASPGLFFAKQFLRHPRMIGSAIPTSSIAIRALLDPVDWASARVVVEYGPGTGVFTRALLARLSPHARLIAIDTNPVFVNYLRDSLKDERLTCVEGSAADVRKILADLGLEAANYIVSGLPFSTLPDGVGDEIMDATQRAIAPGGAFLVYQYSSFVLPYLKARFPRVDVDRVWRCIPPAQLFWARKDAAAVSVCGESLAAE